MSNQDKIQKIEKENIQLAQKVESQLALLLEGQKINLDELRLGFIGIYQQNQELQESNRQFNEKLETVLAELNQIKKEREEKEIRKQARANRKRLPKRDPMTAEIYKELIKEAEGPTYINVRLRLALCLLSVTGVRINELLNIKVFQLETLTQENWIAIDRSKRGPSNHKAFLTKEGKKIIQDRKKGFSTHLFNERTGFLCFYIRS
jgi:integrase